MRAVVQRVSRGLGVGRRRQVMARSGRGCWCCWAWPEGDGEADADWLAAKIPALRIFRRRQGRMNEPLGEREVLCVSQFTLLGDARRGQRPSFVAAAAPELAEPLYERFCELLGPSAGCSAPTWRWSW